MIAYEFPLARVTALLFLPAAILFPARSQDQSAPTPTAVDLAAASGAVSVRHGDTGPWTAAAVGSALSSGDHIATGPKAQADIRLDGSNVFQAAANTEIRLDRLELGQYSMSVIKGSLTCHVASTSVADSEVRTPSVAVRTVKPGVYLIAVNRAGESEITPRVGDVEVVAPLGSEWVGAGQKMVARGPASDPQYKIGNAIPLWRRIATIVATSIDVANTIGASVSTSGGETHTSSSKTAASAPAKSSVPASPAAGSRPANPSPAPPSPGRAKG